MSDLLSNPDDLFLNPHLFIVHSDADEEDRRLAISIAQQCRAYTRPQSGTLEQLQRQSLYGRRFPGITFLILSPAMLAEPARRAALVRYMFYQYQQTLFQHYCVYRGMAAASLREYPELNHLLDNMMVADADAGLTAVLSELHDFATQILPNTPERAQPIANLFYRAGLRRTLAAVALGLSMIVGWALSLATPAAAALALFWWRGWTPPSTTPLMWFVAFCSGYRLNHLQCGDLWPWLQGRWKLPRHRFIAAGAVATEAERALAVVEPQGNPDPLGTRLSMEALYRSAFGVLAAFYGGALMAAAGSALLIAPAYLVARRLTIAPVASIAIAAVVGYLVPGILERFAHGGIAYMFEYFGLSSAKNSLDRKLAGTPNAKLTAEKGAPPEERELVESFPADDRVLVQRWLYNLRIGLRTRSYRRWFPAPDSAFVSYAWRDDSENSVANGIAAACREARIDCFLDKVTLRGREGVFRMPLASGLAKSTHMFVVITPGVVGGHVVRREIEMAMGRWRGELLPSIICVVEPRVRDELVADPAVPVLLRFLLTFCPRMTPAEAAKPALVRYVIELTRREGKWSEVRLLLWPFTALARVVRLPGVTARDA